MKQFLRALRKATKGVDLSLIVTFILLGLIGIVMVYSASMVPASKGSLTGGYPVASNHFMKRQAVYFMIGVLIILFSLVVRIDFFKSPKVQFVMLLITFGLLALTLLIGKEINGSKNWLNLGFFSLQSSEFLKLASIFYFSYIIDRKLSKQQDYQVSELLPPLLLLVVALILVLLQGDLGGTMLTVAIIVCILLYSDIKNKIKMQIFSIAVTPVILYLVYTLLFDAKNIYRLKRIAVFLNLFQYENNEGYQLTSALISIGNGGLFGKGLGNGVSKLGYLPEPHTDFIFTVVSEELGLLGVLIVLGLYGWVVVKSLIYAGRTINHFYKLICIGIGSYIFIQAFVNIGGVSGTIPLTGVTLPLLSYGGSSMLSVSIAFAVLIMTTRKINRDRASNQKIHTIK
ncbi:cell division protein FtsW [Staphylococcus carnosus]|uniref:FtsW/RodA/SpoVE family cell cycle protein n=1 Tax=Staphylococcus carnosus TaxID=1281 RepID=UPI0006ABE163|nr:FtsW/RodA/SpoVE family cell cycle protein [Staphylococcus carnosus]KOR12923.1 cell division protein FtsW [Staphylococcus carnosus]